MKGHVKHHYLKEVLISALEPKINLMPEKAAKRKTCHQSEKYYLIFRPSICLV